jgi:hypothetical protein
MISLQRCFVAAIDHGRTAAPLMLQTGSAGLLYWMQSGRDTDRRENGRYDQGEPSYRLPGSRRSGGSTATRGASWWMSVVLGSERLETQPDRVDASLPTRAAPAPPTFKPRSTAEAARRPGLTSRQVAVNGCCSKEGAGVQIQHSTRSGGTRLSRQCGFLGGVVRGIQQESGARRVEITRMSPVRADRSTARRTVRNSSSRASVAVSTCRDLLRRVLPSSAATWPTDAENNNGGTATSLRPFRHSCVL